MKLITFLKYICGLRHHQIECLPSSGVYTVAYNFVLLPWRHIFESSSMKHYSITPGFCVLLGMSSSSFHMVKYHVFLGNKACTFQDFQHFAHREPDLYPKNTFCWISLTMLEFVFISNILYNFLPLLPLLISSHEEKWEPGGENWRARWNMEFCLIWFS